MVQRYSYGPGATLAYAEVGNRSGFPLIAHHGMVASIEDAALFRVLFPHCRVILVARPGYGESSPTPLANVGDWGAVVSGLADELGIDRFSVLGASSGAPYAYALARAQAPRVRSVFIFSGTPALDDAQVQGLWPYPIDPRADLPSLQNLAHELFFSFRSEDERTRFDVRDSMAHRAFGPALDLQIRVRPWGFDLSEVKAPVFLQHAVDDDQVPFSAAARTAQLLPDCRFEQRTAGGHFTPELFERFLETTVLGDLP